MKNYSSRRTKRGKTAFRTPRRFIAEKTIYERQRTWRPCLPTKTRITRRRGIKLNVWIRKPE